MHTLCQRGVSGLFALWITFCHFFTHLARLSATVDVGGLVPHSRRNFTLASRNKTPSHLEPAAPLNVQKRASQAHFCTVPQAERNAGLSAIRGKEIPPPISERGFLLGLFRLLRVLPVVRVGQAVAVSRSPSGLALSNARYRKSPLGRSQLQQKTEWSGLDCTHRSALE